MRTEQHTAWRTFNDGAVGYVESITKGQGDRYSYTSDVGKAKPLTDTQARAFCAYMRDCGTVGFWS